MNQFSVLLLIIQIIMLGYPLPHVHASSIVDGSNRDTQRPHIHLHGHGHHHHESPWTEVKSELTVVDSGNHDSDAVYFVASDASFLCSSQSVVASGQAIEWIDCFLGMDIDLLTLYRERQPPDRLSKLPIYLLTASLLL